MMKQESSAPMTRLVDMLSGDVASPVMGILSTASDIHDAIHEADTLRSAAAERDELEAELTTMRDAFKAAVGFYDCPCGSEFEFFEDSSLEAYAALNRWLGEHGSTCDVRRKGVTLQAQSDELALELAEEKQHSAELWREVIGLRAKVERLTSERDTLRAAVSVVSAR